MKAVEVDGLTRYFGETTAVKDLRFNVAPGEIFGLLGPNGAGKTTTIRMLSTVLSPHSGTARVNGYDIKKEAQGVRESIGVLTTFVGLYERLSARENIEYFARLYGIDGDAMRTRVAQLLKSLEAEDFQDKRASELSSGMRQKIALARSVVHDPAVIIFDEPTLGLDVLASETVRDFMGQTKERGKTIILSTHDMHLAQELCDRVAILHRGEIIAVDEPSRIIEGQETGDLEKAFISMVSERVDG